MRQRRSMELMLRLLKLGPLLLLFLLDAEAKAGDLLSPKPLAVQNERFEGWSVGGLWQNPTNTLTADNPFPPSTSTMTGSLFGVVGDRALQRGIFYGDISASLAGGVIEGQSKLAGTCAGNCYTSLNALGELTFSVGLVFWDKLLLYVGGGPNFAIMNSGQTLNGLHTQFVSGEHGTAGIKFAVDDRWSFLVEGERVRLGDLYYNTPIGGYGVNIHDFWMTSIGFQYRFGVPDNRPTPKYDTATSPLQPVD